MQPNFEKIKTAFYQAFVNSDIATSKILIERVSNTAAELFHKREQEFKKNLTEWLNTIDIRQASTLISILKENHLSVPKWAASGNYVIDYNDKGALDLLIKVN